MSLTSNVVTWFELYVNDMNRAKAFYSTVLQMELTDLPSPSGMEEMQMACFPYVEGAPNANGALVKDKMTEPGSGGTLIYFATENCTQEQNRVEAAGGKVLQPKFPIGDYGFCAICMDTEGNSFGLHSRK